MRTDTDQTRFWCVGPVKQGLYELSRRDQFDEPWLEQLVPVGNREMIRHPLRGVVVDFVSREAINGAEVCAELPEYLMYGDINYSKVNVFYISTNQQGLYTIGTLERVEQDAFASKPEHSEQRFPDLGMPQRALYDVVFALLP